MRTRSSFSTRAALWRSAIMRTSSPRQASISTWSATNLNWRGAPMPEYSIIPAAAPVVSVPANGENFAITVPQRDLSVSAHDIMGRSPPWILRSGVTALAAALALALFLSWLIRYPDTIQGRIAITGNAPAVPLVAKQRGNLERLDVAEGDA